MESFQRKRFRFRHLFFSQWGILAIFAFIILVGTGFAYLALYSGIFRIDSFTVNGNTRAGSKRVIDAASLELLRESPRRALFGPESLLFWGFHKAELKPRTDALLASIRIRADFFEKQVTLTVSEREFQGLWCLSRLENNTQCFAFDSEKIVIRRVPEAYGSLIFKVRDENSRMLTPGVLVWSDSEELSRIFKTIRIMENIYGGISVIEIKSRELREWTAISPQRIVFAFSTDFIPENLESILRALRERPDFDVVSFVDFRVPNRVYYK